MFFKKKIKATIIAPAPAAPSTGASGPGNGNAPKSDLQAVEAEPAAFSPDGAMAANPSSPTEDELLELIRQNLGLEFSLKNSENPQSEKADSFNQADPLEAGTPGRPRPADQAELSSPWLQALIAAEKPHDQGELAEIRRLILGREIELIELLRKHLSDPDDQIQALSRIITEAILLRQRRDDTLKAVLKPTVINIIRQSIRQDPDRVAESLFPAIGPAIRRSISETLRGMLQSLSKSLEMSFTLKGLKWRWEALRSGRPFSEVVMMHTMVYQVEQVFFIHAKTGLVLNHVVYEGVASQDADMVAGMLTAIQDFVKTSFAQGSEDALNVLMLGERAIYVERMPSAYLACVVRGTPPVSLPSDLRAALGLMVRECSDDLERFNGDAAPFAKARHYATDLLVARFVDEDKKIPWPIKLLPLLLILGIVGVLGFFKYQDMRMDKAIRSVTANSPGLVLIEMEPSLLGDWKLEYLKDALAPGVEDRLAAAGVPLDRLDITYIPYLSMDKETVRARVMNSITVPDTVRLSFDDDGTLKLSGVAPLGWILATREKALTIAGVKAIDFTDLKDPRAEKLRSMVAEVDSLVIHFPLNKGVPVPEDMGKLARAVDLIIETEKLAQTMDLAVSLTIYGHADASGSVTYNYNLSQERAKILAAMLYAKGSSVPIFTYGLGSSFASKPTADMLNREMEPADASQRRGKNQTPEPPEANQESRKIELRLHLSRLGSSVMLED